MDIEGAIYTHLTGDSTLTGMLAVYRNAPAVFMESPVPDDARRPFVVINSVSDVPLDTLAEEGREVIRDIGCYADYTGSQGPVLAITERVRELFHHRTVAVNGYSNFITTVSGIILAPTDRTISGRIVSVRFSLRKI